MVNIAFKLGSYAAIVKEAVANLHTNKIMSRIWEIDHTVWKDDPTEISNRLGWLTIMDTMNQDANREQLQSISSMVKEKGYTDVLLLGMGGSSLAPEVFSFTFGSKEGHPRLHVLDSTDPGAVLAYDKQLDPAKTLFIVATKSGGTSETLSFFKYFYNRTADTVGQDKAGEHFIAITDPGSKLVDIANQYNFADTCINDPNIGGRYSALSFFGLLPAVLIGVDLDSLLQSASSIAQSSIENADNNFGAKLGVIMGQLAQAGRDKVTFITSPSINSFGDWVEQLIAESTGKEGNGILPVVNEPIGSPDVYNNDRLFVYLRLNGEGEQDAAIEALHKAGHPLVEIDLDNKYDLGGQFFLWEMATAVAGQQLAINPFDQPNVESAKVLARKMIDAYQQDGKLPEIEAALAADGITVYGDVSASTPGAALVEFLSKAGDDAYVTLQPYLTPESATTEALDTLRLKIRNTTKHATTNAYGPRFLHSTGQLHKGDKGNGMFIQFSANPVQDIAIPDEAGKPESGMSFNTLKQSQMLGDRQALLDGNRHVITFDLGSDIVGSLEKLTSALDG